MPYRKPSPSRRNQANTDGTPGRRKLLKSALLGGGAAGAWYLAPERWTRPVIQSVTLPAHAQTSVITLSAGPWASDGRFRDVRRGGPRSGNLAGRISDYLLSPARAGLDMEPVRCPFIICLSRTGNGNELLVRLLVALALAPLARTVTPSDDLSFTNLRFSEDEFEWVMDGSFDPDADAWSGSLQGPCPGFGQEQEASELSRRSPVGSVFTGESVQVASASEHLHLALADVDPPQFDDNWTALRSECRFDEF